MDLFNKGQKVSLFFPKDSDLIEIVSTIESIEEDRLILELPKYFMRYIDNLQVGCQLMAKGFTKFGTIDFNTIVIDSPLEEAFSVELDYNAIKLTEAKDMPAVAAIENIKIKCNHGEYELKTFALSGFTVKFNSDAPFSVNDNLECKLTLPGDYGIINFRAVVTEIDPVYETEYTATYMAMSEVDRQNLLYYIYMYV